MASCERPSLGMRSQLRDLFESEVVIARGSDKSLSRVLDGLLTRREIEAVLPGVYTLPGLSAMTEVKIRALKRYEPDAILLEHAAAHQSFWPTLPVDAVAAAVPRSRTLNRKGFRLLQRQVPLDLVQSTGGLRMTVPALTALDLGADAIDFALRTKAATLSQMWAALESTPRHRGNAARRLVLQESSDEPWSAAERQLHRLLREAGITGWVGNLPLTIDGSLYVVDVAFRGCRLAIEVDGRAFHGDANFERDRWRQNDLVLAGWHVLRFTWRMIDDNPDRVVAAVERALGRWGGVTPSTCRSLSVAAAWHRSTSAAFPLNSADQTRV